MTARSTFQQWAIDKLLAWQPSAQHIRFEGSCHCKSYYLLSYTLPGDVRRPGDEQNEHCGYYCPRCEFSNAGSRPVESQMEDVS